MKKILIKFSTFLFLLLLNISLFAQTKDLFEDANNFYGSRQYAQALSAYQKIFDENSDAAVKAKSLVSIGLAYQKLKQYDRAIETFEKFYAAEANDNDAVIQAYRVYQSSAQREIRNTLFAKGNYQGALAEHRARGKYSSPSRCGTGRANQAKKEISYEAAILERLGRYDEAIALYFKIDDPRLAEIYEANGQLEDLKAIIAKKDEPKIVELQKKYAWTREYIAKSLDSRELSETIAIYELEKANDTAALMNLARQFLKSSGSGKGEVVAKMLARRPQQTIPFINSMLKKDGYLSQYFFRVLGLTGTPEAIAVLQELAEKEKNSWDSMALVEGLGLAGESALKKLEGKTLSENMIWALRRYRNGGAEDETGEKIKFPPLPQIKLPIAF